ncbi:hypothetical protein ACFL3D_01555, partial [Candidatus Omnitrophota bacterium]
MKNNVLLKSIAALTTFVFAFTTVAWSAPQGFQSAYVDEETTSSATTNGAFGAYSLTIPSELADVTSRFKGRDDHTVVVIEDAHLNEEVQHNISELIKELVDSYVVNSADAVASDIVIGLEGGVGQNLLLPYRARAAESNDNSVFNYLVREGMLSGAELRGITNSELLNMYGIEDKDVYNKNLSSIVLSIPERTKLLVQLNEIEKVLSAIKSRMYSQSLREFEEALVGYQNETLTFFQYCDQLLDIVEEKSISIDDLDNIGMYAEVHAMEGRIDFAAVKEELEQLVSVLSLKLEELGRPNDKSKIEAFVEKLNNGGIKESGFFRYIQNLAFECRVHLMPYPNVYAYTQYLEKYACIDKHALRIELGPLEGRVSAMLARTADEKKLFRLSQNVSLIKSAIEFKVFRRQKEFLASRKDEFKASEYISFIAQKASMLGINYSLSLDIAYIDRIIPRVFQFYEYSNKRDHYLVDNLLAVAGHGTLSGALTEDRLYYLRQIKTLMDLFKSSPTEEELDVIEDVINMLRDWKSTCPDEAVVSELNKIVFAYDAGFTDANEVVAIKNSSEWYSYFRILFQNAIRKWGVDSARLFPSSVERIAKAPFSIMVVGGYHTQGVQAGLRAKNISFVVASPHINGHQDGIESLYYQRLFGYNDPLSLLFSNEIKLLVDAHFLKPPVSAPMLQLQTILETFTADASDITSSSKSIFKFYHLLTNIVDGLRNGDSRLVQDNEGELQRDYNITVTSQDGGVTNLDVGIRGTVFGLIQDNAGGIQDTLVDAFKTLLAGLLDESMYSVTFSSVNERQEVGAQGSVGEEIGYSAMAGWRTKGGAQAIEEIFLELESDIKENVDNDVVTKKHDGILFRITGAELFLDPKAAQDILDESIAAYDAVIEGLTPEERISYKQSLVTGAGELTLVRSDLVDETTDWDEINKDVEPEIVIRIVKQSLEHPFVFDSKSNAIIISVNDVLSVRTNQSSESFRSFVRFGMLHELSHQTLSLQRRVLREFFDAGLFAGDSTVTAEAIENGGREYVYNLISHDTRISDRIEILMMVEIDLDRLMELELDVFGGIRESFSEESPLVRFRQGILQSPNVVRLNATLNPSQRTDLRHQAYQDFSQHIDEIDDANVLLWYVDYIAQHLDTFLDGFDEGSTEVQTIDAVSLGLLLSILKNVHLRSAKKKTFEFIEKKLLRQLAQVESLIREGRLDLAENEKNLISKILKELEFAKGYIRERKAQKPYGESISDASPSRERVRQAEKDREAQKQRAENLFKAGDILGVEAPPLDRLHEVEDSDKLFGYLEGIIDANGITDGVIDFFIKMLLRHGSETSNEALEVLHYLSTVSTQATQAELDEYSRHYESLRNTINEVLRGNGQDGIITRRLQEKKFTKLQKNEYSELFNAFSEGVKAIATARTPGLEIEFHAATIKAVRDGKNPYGFSYSQVLDGDAIQKTCQDVVQRRLIREKIGGQKDTDIDQYVLDGIEEVVERIKKLPDSTDNKAYMIEFFEKIISEHIKNVAAYDPNKAEDYNDQVPDLYETILERKDDFPSEYKEDKAAQQAAEEAIMFLFGDRIEKLKEKKHMTEQGFFFKVFEGERRKREVDVVKDGKVVKEQRLEVFDENGEKWDTDQPGFLYKQLNAARDLAAGAGNHTKETIRAGVALSALALKMSLGYYHYDVQSYAGVQAGAYGYDIQASTGFGKTETGITIATLYWILDIGKIDVLVTDGYFVYRDHAIRKPAFDLLGISTTAIDTSVKDEDGFDDRDEVMRRYVGNFDIVTTTAPEMAFNRLGQDDETEEKYRYLTDKSRGVAIVDESDYVLIDLLNTRNIQAHPAALLTKSEFAVHNLADEIATELIGQGYGAEVKLVKKSLFTRQGKSEKWEVVDKEGRTIIAFDYSVVTNQITGITPQGKEIIAQILADAKDKAQKSEDAVLQKRLEKVSKEKDPDTGLNTFESMVLSALMANRLYQEDSQFKVDQKDGEVVLIDFRASKLTQKGQRSQGYLGVQLDIKARKEQIRLVDEFTMDVNDSSGDITQNMLYQTLVIQGILPGAASGETRITDMTRLLSYKELKDLLRRNNEQIEEAMRSGKSMFSEEKINTILGADDDKISEYTLAELIEGYEIIRRVQLRSNSITANETDVRTVVKRLHYFVVGMSGTNADERLMKEKDRSYGHEQHAAKKDPSQVVYKGTKEIPNFDRSKTTVSRYFIVHSEAELYKKRADELLSMLRGGHGRAFAFDGLDIADLREFMNYLINDRADDVFEALRAAGYQINVHTGDMTEDQKDDILKRSGFRTVLLSTIFQRGAEAAVPFAGGTVAQVYEKIIEYFADFAGEELLNTALNDSDLAELGIDRAALCERFRKCPENRDLELPKDQNTLTLKHVLWDIIETLTSEKGYFNYATRAEYLRRIEGFFNVSQKFLNEQVREGHNKQENSELDSILGLDTGQMQMLFSIDAAIRQVDEPGAETITTKDEKGKETTITFEQLFSDMSALDRASLEKLYESFLSFGWIDKLPVNVKETESIDIIRAMRNAIEERQNLIEGAKKLEELNVAKEKMYVRLVHGVYYRTRSSQTRLNKQKGGRVGRLIDPGEYAIDLVLAPHDEEDMVTLADEKILRQGLSSVKNKAAGGVVSNGRYEQKYTRVLELLKERYALDEKRKKKEEELKASVQEGVRAKIEEEITEITIQLIPIEDEIVEIYEIALKSIDDDLALRREERAAFDDISQPVNDANKEVVRGVSAEIFGTAEFDESQQKKIQQIEEDMQELERYAVVMYSGKIRRFHEGKSEVEKARAHELVKRINLNRNELRASKDFDIERFVETLIDGLMEKTIGTAGSDLEKRAEELLKLHNYLKHIFGYKNINGVPPKITFTGISTLEEARRMAKNPNEMIKDALLRVLIYDNNHLMRRAVLERANDYLGGLFDEFFKLDKRLRGMFKTVGRTNTDKLKIFFLHKENWKHVLRLRSFKKAYSAELDRFSREKIKRGIESDLIEYLLAKGPDQVAIEEAEEAHDPDDAEFFSRKDIAISIEGAVAKIQSGKIKEEMSDRNKALKMLRGILKIGISPILSLFTKLREGFLKILEKNERVRKRVDGIVERVDAMETRFRRLFSLRELKQVRVRDTIDEGEVLFEQAGVTPMQFQPEPAVVNNNVTPANKKAKENLEIAAESAEEIIFDMSGVIQGQARSEEAATPETENSQVEFDRLSNLTYDVYDGVVQTDEYFLPTILELRKQEGFRGNRLVVTSGEQGKASRLLDEITTSEDSLADDEFELIFIEGYDNEGNPTDIVRLRFTESEMKDIFTTYFQAQRSDKPLTHDQLKELQTFAGKLPLRTSAEQRVKEDDSSKVELFYKNGVNYLRISSDEVSEKGYRETIVMRIDAARARSVQTYVERVAQNPEDYFVRKDFAIIEASSQKEAYEKVAASVQVAFGTIVVGDSIVGEKSTINAPVIDNSYIAPESTISKNVMVVDSRFEHAVIIHEGVNVRNAYVASECEIKKNATVEGLYSGSTSPLIIGENSYVRNYDDSQRLEDLERFDNLKVEIENGNVDVVGEFNVFGKYNILTAKHKEGPQEIDIKEGGLFKRFFKGIVRFFKQSKLKREQQKQMKKVFKQTAKGKSRAEQSVLRKQLGLPEGFKRLASSSNIWMSLFGFIAFFMKAQIISFAIALGVPAALSFAAPILFIIVASLFAKFVMPFIVGKIQDGFVLTFTHYSNKAQEDLNRKIARNVVVPGRKSDDELEAHVQGALDKASQIAFYEEERKAVLDEIEMLRRRKELLLDQQQQLTEQIRPLAERGKLPRKTKKAMKKTEGEIDALAAEIKEIEDRLRNLNDALEENKQAIKGIRDELIYANKILGVLIGAPENKKRGDLYALQASIIAYLSGDDDDDEKEKRINEALIKAFELKFYDLDQELLLPYVMSGFLKGEFEGKEFARLRGLLKKMEPTSQVMMYQQLMQEKREKYLVGQREEQKTAEIGRVKKFRAIIKNGVLRLFNKRALSRANRVIRKAEKTLTIEDYIEQLDRYLGVLIAYNPTSELVEESFNNLLLVDKILNDVEFEEDERASSIRDMLAAENFTKKQRKAMRANVRHLLVHHFVALHEQGLNDLVDDSMEYVHKYVADYGILDKVKFDILKRGESVGEGARETPSRERLKLATKLYKRNHIDPEIALTYAFSHERLPNALRAYMRALKGALDDGAKMQEYVEGFEKLFSMYKASEEGLGVRKVLIDALEDYARDVDSVEMGQALFRQIGELLKEATTQEKREKLFTVCKILQDQNQNLDQEEKQAVFAIFIDEWKDESLLTPDIIHAFQEVLITRDANNEISADNDSMHLKVIERFYAQAQRAENSYSNEIMAAEMSGIVVDEQKKALAQLYRKRAKLRQSLGYYQEAYDDVVNASRTSGVKYPELKQLKSLKRQKARSYARVQRRAKHKEKDYKDYSAKIREIRKKEMVTDEDQKELDELSRKRAALQLKELLPKKEEDSLETVRGQWYEAIVKKGLPYDSAFQADVAFSEGTAAYVQLQSILAEEGEYDEILALFKGVEDSYKKTLRYNSALSEDVHAMLAHLFYRKARYFDEKGLYHSARECYKLVLAYDNDFSLAERVRFRLGSLSWANGDINNAVSMFDSMGSFDTLTSEEKSQVESVYRDYARDHFKQFAYAHALDYLEKLAQFERLPDVAFEDSVLKEKILEEMEMAFNEADIVRDEDLDEKDKYVVIPEEGGREEYVMEASAKSAFIDHLFTRVEHGIAMLDE